MKFEQGKAYLNPTTGNKLLYLGRVRTYFQFAYTNCEGVFDWDVLSFIEGCCEGFTEWKEPKPKVKRWQWALKTTMNFSTEEHAWRDSGYWATDLADIKRYYNSTRPDSDFKRIGEPEEFDS